ncbi:hypothetical protein DPMN_024155 [Dreissena polymorpha]|uniref:UBX domain-containing protein n=2 Tax=Dreissena polymorpha TaxID=45954 RepID=A0A9D4LP87_DREPO|nr:hypothetical protein DPMN_024155 [Dreissena polymorpha]
MIPLIGIDHPSLVVWRLFRLSVQALLVYVFGSLVFRTICALWRKTRNFWYKNTTTIDEINPVKVQDYEVRRHLLADDQQEKYFSQAEIYKKAILEPRERAKMERKERLLANVLGQNYTGEGRKLGSRVPVVVAQVITLPEQPEEVDPTAVTVTIDDGKGQRHTRRFSEEHTVQTLNDYMSILGFAPERYSLCTAYPRKQLPDRPNMTIKELDFSRRTLLFVQEKDDESD